MKKILSLLLVLAMVLTLAACGGGNETPSGNETPNSGNNAGSDVAADPNAPKELKIGVNTAPQNISPFTHFTNRQPVQMYLYETLAKRDAEGNWYGVIAKNWTTEDNIVYDIEIYDCVYDTNGNQIKAEDVAWSMEQSKGEAANIWVVSCVATGEYTVRLTLSDDAVSTFPTAIDRAPIVSKASYEASEDGMATSSVSSAPYMVTEFVPNVSITFEKNPNYWQKDEAVQSNLYKQSTLDKMSFVKISEAAQQTIALETGSIDVFYEIASTEVTNFLEGGRDAEGFNNFPIASNLSYVFYYSSQGIMAEDLNLRLAIAHAIDKDAIALGGFAGLAKAANFMGAPDGMSDLTPSNTDSYFPYDLDLAKDYLAKSNYNGEKLKLLVPNEDNHNRIGAIVQGQLHALGIECEITSYDNAIFQSNFRDGSTFDLCVCQMGMTDVVFVWNFLSYELSGGAEGAAGMAVKDEKLDELLGICNTIEGHTVENATKAMDYINEQVYGISLISPTNYTITRKDLNITQIPLVDMSAYYIACAVFG